MITFYEICNFIKTEVLKEYLVQSLNNCYFQSYQLKKIECNQRHAFNCLYKPGEHFSCKDFRKNYDDIAENIEKCTECPLKTAYSPIIYIYHH